MTHRNNCARSSRLFSGFAKDSQLIESSVPNKILVISRESYLIDLEHKSESNNGRVHTTAATGNSGRFLIAPPHSFITLVKLSLSLAIIKIAVIPRRLEMDSTVFQILTE